MDVGKTFVADEGATEPVDFYRLTFWPAHHQPDRLVRQTSRIAAYWHQDGFTRS